jgi:hypothetical protein
MRFISLLSFLLVLNACAGSKTASLFQIQPSDCPAEGICSLEILKNKSLAVKEDTIGQLYYNLEDNNAKTVYIYTYFVAGPENTQDGNLTEKILFELDNELTSNLNYQNNDLQKVSMLFSRACFCRGQMGLYSVSNGLLQYDVQQKKLQVKAITNAVPQAITTFVLF